MGLIRYLRRRLHIQQVNDVCDSTHQKVDRCLKEICSDGGIRYKLDQTIKIQNSLKETGEAILLKAEQNTECQDLQDQCASIQEKADEAVLSLQQIGDLGDEIAVKAAQVVSGQQELSRKADHFIAKQEELGKKVEQAIAGQQELKNKSDQALAVQQDLTKKADQTAAGLQELGKKADRYYSQPSCRHD